MHMLKLRLAQMMKIRGGIDTITGEIHISVVKVAKWIG
jgi:hypothetical protein